MKLTDDAKTIKLELENNSEYNRIVRSNKGTAYCEIDVEGVKFILFRELDSCYVALSYVNDFRVVEERHSQIITFARTLNFFASAARQSFSKDK